MSTGPSGPNIRFVLNLAEGLRQIGLSNDKDQHVFGLEKAVLKLEQGMSTEFTCVLG